MISRDPIKKLPLLTKKQQSQSAFLLKICCVYVASDAIIILI